MTLQRTLNYLTLGMLTAHGVAIGGDAPCTVYASEASRTAETVDFFDFEIIHNSASFPRTNEIRVVDIEDKNNIFVTRLIQGGTQSITSLASYDNYLYYTRRTGAVTVLDMTDPRNPTQLNALDQLGGFPSEIAVTSEFAVVSNWIHDGATVRRMIGPADTELLSYLFLSYPADATDAFEQLVIQDNVLFAAQHNSYSIIKYDLNQKTTGISLPHFERYSSLEVKSNLRSHLDKYLSFTIRHAPVGESGLTLLDVSNPMDTTTIAWEILVQDGDIAPTSIAMSDEFAVVAFDDAHFEIYQLDGFPTTEPMLVGSGSGMDYAFHIQNNDFVIGGQRAHPDDLVDFSGWVIAMDLSICCDLGGADVTGDGELNFFDVSVFIGLYSTGSLDADFTGDGTLDFFDVSAFINAFTSGCR